MMSGSRKTSDQRGFGLLHALAMVAALGAIAEVSYLTIDAKRKTTSFLKAQGKLEVIAVAALGTFKDAFNGGQFKIACKAGVANGGLDWGDAPDDTVPSAIKLQPAVKDRYTNAWGFKSGATEISMTGCTTTGKGIEPFRQAMSSEAGAINTVKACRNVTIKIGFSNFDCVKGSFEAKATALSDGQSATKKALMNEGKGTATKCPYLESLTPVVLSPKMAIFPRPSPLPPPNWANPWDIENFGFKNALFTKPTPDDQTEAGILKNQDADHKNYLTGFKFANGTVTFFGRYFIAPEYFVGTWLDDHADWSWAGVHGMCAYHHTYCFRVQFSIVNAMSPSCTLDNVDMAYIYGGGCLAASTRIRMADGRSKAVKDLVYGDRALNPIKGSPVVIHGVVDAGRDQPVVRLCIQDGQCQILTANHPVATAKGGVPAGRLQRGDEMILGEFKGHAIVQSVDPINGKAPSMKSISLLTNSEDDDDHWLVTNDGLIVGDLFLQRSLASGGGR